MLNYKLAKSFNCIIAKNVVHIHILFTLVKRGYSFLNCFKLSVTDKTKIICKYIHLFTKLKQGNSSFDFD